MDGTVCLWNAETWLELSGHSSCVTSIYFVPNRLRIVTGSYDNTIRIWDSRTGYLIYGPLTGHSHRVRAVSVSLNGKLIASGSNDKTVSIWNANTGDRINVLDGGSSFVLSVAFSPGPNSQNLVSGGDSMVRVWNVDTGDLVGNPFIGHSNCPTSVNFSSDGKIIVSGSYDKTIRVWDASTRTNLDESMNTERRHYGPRHT